MLQLICNKTLFKTPQPLPSSTMATSSKYDIISSTDIDMPESNSIDIQDLNKEVLDCLITGFCKPHCYTNTANNLSIYTMYQYILIKQYFRYQNSTHILLSSFLSYDEHKTNSIESAHGARKFDMDRPDEIRDAKLATLLYLLCQLISIVPLVFLSLPATVLGSGWIAMIIVNSCIFVIVVMSYQWYRILMSWKYYVINFNTYEQEVQKWEIKPRYLTAYGSLKLHNKRDRYFCQLISKETICKFAALESINFSPIPHVDNTIYGNAAIDANILIKHRAGTETFRIVWLKNYDAFMKIPPRVRSITDKIDAIDATVRFHPDPQVQVV